jgi:hypothetical protein
MFFDLIDNVEVAGKERNSSRQLLFGATQSIRLQICLQFWQKEARKDVHFNSMEWCESVWLKEDVQSKFIVLVWVWIVFWGTWSRTRTSLKANWREDCNERKRSSHNFNPTKKKMKNRRQFLVLWIHCKNQATIHDNSQWDISHVPRTWRKIRQVLSILFWALGSKMLKMKSQFCSVVSFHNFIIEHTYVFVDVVGFLLIDNHFRYSWTCGKKMQTRTLWVVVPQRSWTPSNFSFILHIVLNLAGAFQRYLSFVVSHVMKRSKVLSKSEEYKRFRSWVSLQKVSSSDFLETCVLVIVEAFK